VLTKQHGAGLNTWEINFVRFGSAAAALALGAVLRPIIFRLYANLTGLGGRPRNYAHLDADTTGAASKEGGGRGGGGGGGGRGGGVILPRLDTRGWLQVVGGIFMTTFLAPGAGNFALFRVPSLAVFSTLMCVGPIYALPLGYFIKGERVTTSAAVGSVMACVGVIPMFFGNALGFPSC
jgi:drug/metabolite transporter (DMT)-like permease